MKIVVTTLALCLLTPAAAQIIAVPGNPPKGLDCVRGVPGYGPGAGSGASARDVYRECYEAPNAFVVMSKNSAGEGYSLSRNRPKEFQSSSCAVLDDPVRNCISVLPGQKRRYVEAATGLDMPGLETTFHWKTSREIAGAPFGIVTTITFVFNGSELDLIRVFTSASH